MNHEAIKCQKCGKGDLIPLSDYGPDGASVIYKLWMCTDVQKCGLVIRCNKGRVEVVVECHDKIMSVDGKAYA